MKIQKQEEKKEKGKDKKTIGFIFLRYIILVILGLSINLFYIILTPLTIIPVNFILNFFYNSSLVGYNLFVNSKVIEIVEACIAGSAYYLLLILNLSVPMKARKRIKSIFFSILALLVINIIRIITFSVMFIENSSYFEITHKLVWYVLSVIFVAMIWIASIFIFKIKSIPIYSDLKYIYKIKKPRFLFPWEKHKFLS